MSIQFRYVGLSEYPRVSKFLDEYWAKNHIYVREQSLFDWTFTRNKHWEDQTYSFAVAEDDGEIVAILGGIPFAFNCFGKSSKAVWIVNYAVRPDHRRGPAALQLLSTFRKPPFQTVVAAGLNPASTIIYKVLRGTVLPEMPRHFAVFPNAADRMADLLQLTYPDWSRERAASLSDAFVLVENDDQVVSHGTTVPASWDETDWSEIATKTVGAARDADYLNWRYVQHPCFKYSIITVPDGNRTGLAIWRLESIQQETPTGRVPVDRLARLVEFLPASQDNGRALMSALLGEVRAAGALGIDFYGYHGLTRSILQNIGVFSIEAHPDGALIPSRFQPLDTHGGGILNAMFVPEGLPSCTVEPNSPWYWTKSDSDQDRPN
jgi:hypothetical protein